MTKKKKTVKKKNPQDATLRNIRALKKRVQELEDRVKPLEDLKVYLYARIDSFEKILKDFKK